MAAYNLYLIVFQDSFDKDYSKEEKKQIEQLVISDYIEQLRSQCSQELWFVRRGKNNLPKSCKKLEDMTGKKIRV